MTTIPYNKHNIAKNSQAYELFQVYQKAQGLQKTAAKQVLDKHLKEVDQRHCDLMARYK